MRRFAFPLLFLLVVAGCDTVEQPAATIRTIDVELDQPGDFLEIQDVTGRPYVRATSFPASVNLQLWTEGRDYFVVLLRETPDGLRAVGASDGFRVDDLSGASFTTSGNVEAVFTLE